MAVVGLILVAVGVGLVLLGAWVSLREFKKKQVGQLEPEQTSLRETLDALNRLVEALGQYPTGQRLIVFGIVVLVIAGLFGGVAGL